MLTKNDINSAASFIRNTIDLENSGGRVFLTDSWAMGKVVGMQSLVIHLTKSNPSFNVDDFFRDCECLKQEQ